MQDEAAAKRYDSARSYASEAVSAAERAIADGKTGSQRARDEAAALISGLRNTAAETEQNLEAAKRVPGIQLDFYTLGNDLDTANGLTDQAQTSLSGNNYQDAISKGQNARSLYGGITTQISQATIATSRKK
jgi:predicted kinase